MRKEKLEEEYLHNEKQLENEVMKKTKLIDDLQSNLSEGERQLNELKRLEHESTAESIKKGRIDMKNSASELVISKSVLLQKDEQIEFLQEKLEEQKQSIEDQARHLALKSYQTEATLAEIEEKIYSRLYMGISEDLMLKLMRCENSVLKENRIHANEAENSPLRVKSNVSQVTNNKNTKCNPFKIFAQ
ncbi:hypothetical protein HHI36_010674, partial [Cryptolaemus montrouzieri]